MNERSRGRTRGASRRTQYVPPTPPLTCPCGTFSPNLYHLGAPMSDHHRPPQDPAHPHGAGHSAPHSEGTHPEGADTEGADPEGAARFRRTLARVMSMQVAALIALWWLQARYGN